MARSMTALVIGNGGYASAGDLKNPANDAEDISRALQDNGFEAFCATDMDNEAMDRAIKQFGKALEGCDVGLFFFAGHGMQIGGENYLAAVDTDVSDELAAKHSSLALNRVIETMERSKCATSIVILDACRNNPFERAWNRSMASRGLASVYAPRGTLVAFATSPGQVASDGGGRNGAYTAALLQHIAAPDVSIEDMFKRVRNTLDASSKGKQISWEHTSLSGQFFFNLSLGARIDLYGEAALSDRLFAADERKASHRVILELKSSTWPRQNPAADGFKADVANKASADALFVVGRNLYQAACGNSNRAGAFIGDFASRVAAFDDDKAKAVLDGMLFEIFFDPDAKLRGEFKLGRFQEVFALQRHARFASSFDFIAECLLRDSARFHAIPGKRHGVTVDAVTTAGAKGVHRLESIHCGGADILWQDDEDFAPEPGDPQLREKLDFDAFEERIARQMVIPRHLLTINYPSLGKARGGEVSFPLGWTARKR